MNFPPAAFEGSVTFQQIRNATVKIGYGDTTFLVDPLLAPKGTYPGFEGTVNSELRNPLVELPLPLAEVMRADAVIVSHTHLDHWDETAKQALPKDIPLFAQNEEDAASIRADGFTDVRVLGEDTVFRGVQLIRVDGQHGSEALMSVLGKILGKTSGIVFRQPGHRTVYVAGDTVWTPQVEDAIARWRPDVIVLNTGHAQVAGFGDAIIMGKDDLARAHEAAPWATVVAVHLEAVNHMTQSRREVLDYIAEKGIDGARVRVPADGERYRF